MGLVQLSAIVSVVNLVLFTTAIRSMFIFRQVIRLARRLRLGRCH
jgi:hypothetical protein